MEAIPNDTVFGDLNRLQNIMSDLDERGLVLSLAAFAEEALGDLLGAFMQPGEATRSLLTGFNAPLGTLSSRIKASAALGLVTPRQHENLDRLRRLRNEFAHSWEPVSFNDPRLAAHIAALHFTPLVDRFPETPAEKLRATIQALLIEVRSVTQQIVENGWSARLIGTHLIPGLSTEVADPVASCGARLSEISQELPSASGTRRDFLTAQRERWITLLRLLRIQATARDRLIIDRLLHEHDPAAH